MKPLHCHNNNNKDDNNNNKDVKDNKRNSALYTPKVCFLHSRSEWRKDEWRKQMNCILWFRDLREPVLVVGVN